MAAPVSCVLVTIPKMFKKTWAPEQTSIGTDWFKYRVPLYGACLALLLTYIAAVWFCGYCNSDWLTSVTALAWRYGPGRHERQGRRIQQADRDQIVRRALWPTALRCAASTGRIHGCTDQQSESAKVLAKPEPPIHGPSLTLWAVVPRAPLVRVKLTHIAHVRRRRN
jgi:hypothetical protein